MTYSLTRSHGTRIHICLVTPLIRHESVFFFKYVSCLSHTHTQRHTHTHTHTRTHAHTHTHIHTYTHTYAHTYTHIHTHTHTHKHEHTHTLFLSLSHSRIHTPTHTLATVFGRLRRKVGVKTNKGRQTGTEWAAQRGRGRNVLLRNFCDALGPILRSYSNLDAVHSLRRGRSTDG